MERLVRAMQGFELMDDPQAHNEVIAIREALVKQIEAKKRILQLKETFLRKIKKLKLEMTLKYVTSAIATTFLKRKMLNFKR